MKTCWNVSVRSRLNWNLERLLFKDRRKPEYPDKNLSDQRREPTINSTHIWRQRQNLNPDHIGGRRVLLPLGHSCLYSIFSSVLAQRPGNNVSFQYDERLRQLVLRLNLNSILISLILYCFLYFFCRGRGEEGVRGGHVPHQWDFVQIFQWQQQSNNTCLYMLPNQAAKPCIYIGIEVANRMKTNEHNEQLRNVTVVFIILFLQLSAGVLYLVDKEKTKDRPLIAHLPDVKDLLFDLFGKWTIFNKYLEGSSCAVFIIPANLPWFIIMPS